VFVIYCRVLIYYRVLVICRRVLLMYCRLLVICLFLLQPICYNLLMKTLLCCGVL